MKVIKTFFPIEDVTSKNTYYKFASIIPSLIGINLSSVEGIEEKKQDDGKLVSLTIKFK